MSINQIIKKLYQSDDKEILINRGLNILLSYIKYRTYFLSFGRKSVLIKPDRIIGRKQIAIGSNVIIMNHIRLEAIKHWNGGVYHPKIEIQDGVTVGQGCHFTCANEIIIGQGTAILPYALITDIEHEYQIGKSISDSTISVGHIIIGKNVTIGSGAKILAHDKEIIVGDNVVIGANAVVTASIEKNTVVAGIPARQIRILE